MTKVSIVIVVDVNETKNIWYSRN